MGWEGARSAIFGVLNDPKTSVARPKPFSTLILLYENSQTFLPSRYVRHQFIQTLSSIWKLVILDYVRPSCNPFKSICIGQLELIFLLLPHRVPLWSLRTAPSQSAGTNCLLFLSYNSIWADQVRTLFYICPTTIPPCSRNFLPLFLVCLPRIVSSLVWRRIPPGKKLRGRLQSILAAQHR